MERPFFGIRLPLEVAIISERDRDYPTFACEHDRDCRIRFKGGNRSHPTGRTMYELCGDCIDLPQH